MLTMLKNNQDGSYDVVSENEVTIGDEFHNGRYNDKIPIMVSVKQIHEQRKERGVYKDESNRRMWAKVS